jgi:hypothetical protein
MTTTTNGAALEHEIGAAGSFHLRQPSGSIRIRGVEGLVARVRERNGRSLADIFQVEATEGRLTLGAPDRFGFDVVFAIGRRSRPDLEIEVPRGASVTIETANADIEAFGLRGRTKLRTASGEVAIDEVGGTLELEAVSGDVRVAADGTLDLRARTISGDLVVRGPRLERAEIATTSGDVRLDATLSGAGPFGVETVSGDVSIVGRMGITVDARTVTGDLTSDLPHRRDAGRGRKQLVVGNGAIPFAFRSVSGDLRVTAPRDSLAPAHTIAAGETMPTASAQPVEALAAAAPERAADGGREVARLDVLRALERGELSVEVAMRRLAEIEEA